MLKFLHKLFRSESEDEFVEKQIVQMRINFKNWQRQALIDAGEYKPQTDKEE